jgi:hypothetical protein
MTVPLDAVREQPADLDAPEELEVLTADDAVVDAELEEPPLEHPATISTAAMPATTRNRGRGRDRGTELNLPWRGTSFTGPPVPRPAKLIPRGSGRRQAALSPADGRPAQLAVIVAVMPCEKWFRTPPPLAALSMLQNMT